jgi:hypothetical protein
MVDSVMFAHEFQFSRAQYFMIEYIGRNKHKDSFGGKRLRQSEI